MRATLTYCVAVFACVLMTGCGRKAPPRQAPSVTYYTPKTAGGPVIIFVHGFDGDRDFTWTNDTVSPAVHWPTLLARDDRFSGVTIAAYEYNAGRGDGLLKIDELAAQLNSQLQAEGLLERQIVFVCHSMGGLLVRQLIMDNKDRYAPKTQMIYFCSTPFAGSQIATLGIALKKAAKKHGLHGFLGNPQLEQLAEGGRHQWVDEQNGRWINGQFDVKAFAAYEKKPWYGALIVDEVSATHGRPTRVRAMEADHSSICKPLNEKSDVYIDFVNAYTETATDLANQAVKRWPVEECRRLLIDKFGDLSNGIPADQIVPPRFSKDEVELTTKRGSRRELYLGFCDASALITESNGQQGASPGAHPFSCFRLDSSYGEQSGKYFSKFRDPSGWFVLFLRYRDDNGMVVDTDFELVDFFKTNDPFVGISSTTTKSDPFSVRISDHVPAK